jgi:hypothetical protein
MILIDPNPPPPSEELLSPAKRRELFRVEVEKEEAQRFLRKEQGMQKTSVLL